MQVKLNNPSVSHKQCVKNTSNYSNLWINLNFFVPGDFVCLVSAVLFLHEFAFREKKKSLILFLQNDYLNLFYDNKTHTTNSASGIKIKVAAFGERPYVIGFNSNETFVENYFDDINDMLLNLGYSIGHSLRGAPYDFRKGPGNV